jgi:hypothetical protein
MKILLCLILIFTALTGICQDTNRKITGKVRTEDYEPLQGATVRIKGTNVSVVTDSLGKYSISVPQGSTLVFHFIGFRDKELSVTKKRNKINVILEASGREVE